MQDRTPKEKALLRVKLEVIKMRKYCRENNITQRELENMAGYNLNLSRLFNLKLHEVNAGTLFMLADLIGYEIAFTPPKI